MATLSAHLCRRHCRPAGEYARERAEIGGIGLKSAGWPEIRPRRMRFKAVVLPPPDLETPPRKTALLRPCSALWRHSADNLTG